MPAQTSSQLKHWFAKITSHSPFFFAILNDQHQYVMVNERYCDIAGLSSEEMVGMSDSQVLGEHFYRHLKPFYERAFNNEHIESELTLSEIDLETSLHFSLSPIMINDRVQYLVFHAIDTSEKQILVRSLEESESKYALLTTLLPDGLMMVENDCIIS
ncbi:PAS domain S-box protein, partial [Vibrio parahaemolyticus]|nr:PAS domain S-box protein [Vibrio parahaemolyticus]